MIQLTAKASFVAAAEDLSSGIVIDIIIIMTFTSQDVANSSPQHPFSKPHKTGPKQREIIAILTE
jgi:hypothetical protein